MKKLAFTTLAVFFLTVPLACFGVRQNSKDKNKDQGVVSDSIRKYEADMYLSMGVDLYRKQIYDSAIVLFTKSLEKFPNYYKSMVAMAVTYQDSRDIMSASDWYRKIMTTYPDSLEGYLGLAGTYLKLGYTDGQYLDSALFYYGEGIKLFPDDPDFYSGIAKVYQQKGGADAADSVYKEGISKNPDNLALRNAYVDFLIEQKKFSDALEHENFIIKAKPEDPFAWEKLGNILVELKKHKEAAEAYTKVIEYRPDYMDARIKGAAAYMSANEYSKAEKLLLDAVALDTSKLLPHVYLGVLYMNWGKEGQAEKEFLYILSKDPNYSDALYFLGSLYARRAGRSVNETTKEAWQSGCANARTAENYLNKANSIDPKNNGSRVNQQMQYLEKVRAELKKKLFLVGISDC